MPAAVQPLVLSQVAHPGDIAAVFRFSSLISSRFCLVALVIAGCCVGCRPEPQITQYEVPKAETIQLPMPKDWKDPAAAAPSAGRPERMLGAIVPQGDQLWFFKVTGPIPAVSERVEEFRTFIESIAFNAKGEPQWQLPAGWQQQAGSGMRFSTLTIGENPPLELSVIALPGSEEPLPPQILANINRWRGQLSLQPISLEQLDQESQSIPTKSAAAATFVDYTGTSSGGGMMAGPFAGGAGGMGGGMSASPLTAPAADAPAAGSDLTYQTPPGWKVGRVGGLRKAAFEVAADNRKAEITVIDLAADAGARLPNVNRWRGQIGLPEVTAEQLAESMTKINVGGIEGDYVVLEGDAQAANPQTILGVILEHGGKSWFIKLQGDAELAKTERAHFEAFVNSLKLE